MTIRPVDPTPTHTPQHALANLRAHLLDGRGPGASATEVAAHTRDRPWLGGQPTVCELERVATQATRARTGQTGSDRLMRVFARGLRLAVAGTIGAMILTAVLRHLARTRRDQRHR